jgi:serine protease
MAARRALRATQIALAPCALALLASVFAPASLSASASPPKRFSKRGPASWPASYAPDKIVVGYTPVEPVRTGGARYAQLERAGQADPAVSTRLVHVATGTSMTSALARLRATRGVAWAVPDYIAHVAGEPAPQSALETAPQSEPEPAPATPAAETIPNDEGNAHTLGGWQKLQWNFVGRFGVNAPEAWANVAADGAPGGKGTIVAVLDTGVAYATRGRFERSPDLSRYTFVKGYDFVAKDPYAYDRNGHGTFVASTIAEETNNHYGLTGLAFAARIMPVRVLDSQGEGEASTIAEGVYFAVKHHAQVINLSLEFSPGVTAADIPELIAALDYAHRHGVLVVAASGNEGHRAIAYPAHAPNVVSVGATTEDGCLADYSNDGAGLTLVAPGGGDDANLPGDPNCRPEASSGRDIYQVTLTGSSLTKFGMPSGYEGTSMATAHVAAIAALIIASGVIGHHPTPAQITARLRATARKLGGPDDARLYGAGLVDAAAATAPGGPGAVAR